MQLNGDGSLNPLNAELNPICHLLTLLGGATIVVVSRLKVKSYRVRKLHHGLEFNIFVFQITELLYNYTSHEHNFFYLQHFICTLILKLSFLAVDSSNFEVYITKVMQKSLPVSMRR